MSDSHSPPSRRRRRRRASAPAPPASPGTLKHDESESHKEFHGPSNGTHVVQAQKLLCEWKREATTWLPVVEGQREAPASMARSAARKRSRPARSPVTAAERHPRRAACCCWGWGCGCAALGFVASSAPAVAVAVAVMYTLIAGVDTARSLYARLPSAD